MTLISDKGPPADNPDHPLNFFKHRRDLLKLSGTEYQHTVQSRIIELTQGAELALQISVSPYVPLPGDKTAYEWSTKDGTQCMEMPAYRIDDVEDAKARIRAYVQLARPVYLKAFLDGSNKLLWNTFDIAQRSKVSDQALKVSHRLTSVSHKVTYGSNGVIDLVNHSYNREDVENMWARACLWQLQPMERHHSNYSDHGPTAGSDRNTWDSGSLETKASPSPEWENIRPLKDKRELVWGVPYNLYTFEQHRSSTGPVLPPLWVLGKCRQESCYHPNAVNQLFLHRVGMDPVANMAMRRSSSTILEPCSLISTMCAGVKFRSLWTRTQIVCWIPLC